MTAEARLPQKTAVLLSQIFVEKKRTISEFQNIKKIQSKFILTATSFFIFVAIAPVVIYVLASHFTKEVNLNITLLGQTRIIFHRREGGREEEAFKPFTLSQDKITSIIE